MGNLTIDEDHDGTLVAIQSGCANVKTLMTIRNITYPINCFLGYLDDSIYLGDMEIATEALTVVNTYFRATFPSLQEIIIEVYEDDLGGRYMKKQMKKQGWIIIAKGSMKHLLSDTSSDEWELMDARYVQYDGDCDDDDDEHNSD